MIKILIALTGPLNWSRNNPDMMLQKTNRKCIGFNIRIEPVLCTRLKITNKGRIVFHIDGKNYHTYYFDVVI